MNPGLPAQPPGLCEDEIRWAGQPLDPGQPAHGGNQGTKVGTQRQGSRRKKYGRKRQRARESARAFQPAWDPGPRVCLREVTLNHSKVRHRQKLAPVDQGVYWCFTQTQGGPLAQSLPRVLAPPLQSLPRGLGGLLAPGSPGSSPPHPMPPLPPPSEVPTEPSPPAPVSLALFLPSPSRGS